jgi:hypothetical protein
LKTREADSRGSRGLLLTSTRPRTSHRGIGEGEKRRPIDEPDDLALSIWAGQVPLQLRADEPIADVDLPAPDYLTRIAVPR